MAGGTDLVRSYLRDIGRVPLLTHEQEITLGRQVQELVALEELEQELASREGVEKPSPAVLAKEAGLTQVQLKKRLRSGQRAKERMVAANLRLVVSVAKKYTKRNMELLDLIQEGTIGLVRGVEKFDPTRGYKFSTYAYWWIRQGITRAIAEKSRTIRLPIHITETLNKLKKGQRELSQELVALEELEQELASREGVEKPSPAVLAKEAGLTQVQLKKRLRSGQRAKERMVAANLRLVVSVAKKYTKRNMELLDLIQEGTIG